MAAILSTVIIAGITVGQLALAALSITYQIYQSKKARKAARDAAEARKGYELVVEGSIQPVPLVYGRAKVGGVRVFTDTSSNFNFVPTNADKVFSLGIESEQATVFPDYQLNPTTGLYELVNVPVPATEGGFLSKTITGSKNEFLYMQQALCAGPIQGVVDILISERDLKDPSLVSGTSSKPKAALRVDCHNNLTDHACNIISANFGQRSTAIFPEVAYMSSVVRLDRDNPQFSNAPDIQAILEGRLVHGINAAGTELTPRAYSNNPALCLLDYLMDTQRGGAQSLDQIDLLSFRDAAAVCNTIVLDDAAVGGKIWQPLDGARVVTARDIPLYEANLIIDTTKPIRDNVGVFLACMGDARLVWSQGQYKLLLQYPRTNEDVITAGELTDDDLVLSDNVDITWPTTSERLNYATVRYHDEASDFAESSASWPPKEAGVYSRGVGLRTYAPMSGWSGSDEKSRLLNNLAVWYSNEQQTKMRWTFFVRVGGSCTLKFAADDECQGNINGVPFSGDFGEVNVNLVRDTVAVIEVTLTNTGKNKGFAGTLTDPRSLQIWTTRSPAYDQTTIVNQTSVVYDTYKEADNGIQLETDVFGDGITDYYHALAKAEELVRTSRSAFVIKLKYLIKDRYFEPGDMIRVTSEVLKINNLILRVSEAQVVDGLTAEISCSRFDWTQLAWNVDDNQAAPPTGIWTSILAAPEWVRYQDVALDLGVASGRVTWAPVDDVRISHYRVYFHPPGAYESNGQPTFREIGRTADLEMDVPQLAHGAGVFGVRASTAAGTLSQMTLTEPVVLVKGAMPPKPINLTAVPAKAQSQVDLTWEIPNVRADGTAYTDHQTTLLWRAISNKWEDRKSIGQSAGTTFTDNSSTSGEVWYWAQAVSRSSVESEQSDVVGPVKFFIPGSQVDPDADKPPGPSGLKVTAGLTFFSLEWVVPETDVGGGIRASRVYGYEWQSGDTGPGEYQFLGETTSDIFFHPAAINKQWSFIIRVITHAGGLSESFAGPVTSKTGRVGNSDLGEQIIDAENIRDNSISNQKFIPGLEGITYETVIPTTKKGETVSVKGILYKWDAATGAYKAVVNTEEMVGQIVGTQIANAAISVAKFAQGLAPVELVNALPTTGNFEGRVVSLTTDNGALYHFQGGAWKANVPTNSITATQITDGAISTPKILAGAINADKIAANAITAGKIQAGAISAREIAARAISAAEIAVGTLTANEIASNAITAAKIQAGAITSDKIIANAITAGKIATGAITADKMAVGSITAGNAAIADLAVGNAAIQNGAITTAKIFDLAVNTAKIQDASITNAKIQNLTVDSLKIADYAVSIAFWATSNTGNQTVYIDVPAGQYWEAMITATWNGGQTATIGDSPVNRVTTYSLSGNSAPTSVQWKWWQDASGSSVKEDPVTKCSIAGLPGGQRHAISCARTGSGAGTACPVILTVLARKK